MSQGSDMASKRLTYLTEDGKRHWVRIQRYVVPEGVVFALGGAESYCRNRSELPQAKDTRPVLAKARAPDRSRLAVHNQDR